MSFVSLFCPNLLHRELCFKKGHKTHSWTSGRGSFFFVWSSFQQARKRKFLSIFQLIFKISRVYLPDTWSFRSRDQELHSLKNEINSIWIIFKSFPQKKVLLIICWFYLVKRFKIVLSYLSYLSMLNFHKNIVINLPLNEVWIWVYWLH